MDEVTSQFKTLSEQLEFRLSWKEEPTVGSMLFGSIRLDDENLWIGISKRQKNPIAVDIHHHNGLIEQFEGLLKLVLESVRTPIPGESFWMQGVEEESGPLLLYVENPHECFGGVRFNIRENDDVNFTPQIRVISSSLGNLEESQEIAKEYSVSSKIIRDNLWIDFWWSNYSESWKMH